MHESKGVTDDYLRLESLIQKVVSPYLGTHGLYSRDESSSMQCSSCLLGNYVLLCVWKNKFHLNSGFLWVFFFFNVNNVSLLLSLEKRLQHSWPYKLGNSPAVKNPVIRSKSYNVPMLTPVVEYDIDSSTGSGTGIRRHSVSEMTSCVEESIPKSKSSTCASDNNSTTSTSSLTSHSPASTAFAAVSGRTIHLESTNPPEITAELKIKWRQAELIFLIS